MLFKKELALLVVSLLLITGFFLLPRNQKWASVILRYWQSLPNQARHLDKNYRLELRFENDYRYSKQIADYFKKKGMQDTVLVLMPPTSYFTKMGMTYHVPEPAVFYYYTGLKTVWANSAEAVKADWYVHVTRGKIIIDSVTDRSKLQQTIYMFQKSGVTL
jgi:hypothetical protein